MYMLLYLVLTCIQMYIQSCGYQPIYLSICLHEKIISVTPPPFILDQKGSLLAGGMRNVTNTSC